MPLDIASVRLIEARQRAAGWAPHVRGQLGADATLYQPGAINTPFDLRTAAQQTDRFIAGLNDALQNVKKVPLAWYQGWQKFFTEWQRFYANNFSGIVSTTAHWLTSDLQSQLVNYQQQAGVWAKQAAKYKASAPGPGPEEPASDTKKTLMYVGLAVVGLGTLFLVAKLVHTAVLGGAALEEAEQTAVALADAQRRKKSNRRVVTIS